jgi:SAM-dependent methyltransferase
MKHGTGVSDAGIRVDPAHDDEVLDVLFDGARVWSFLPSRDGSKSFGDWLVPWPKLLQPFLSGRTQVTVRSHGTADSLYDDEVGFGDSSARIRVVDKKGNPLAIDKGGRLQRSFDDTDDSTRDFIVQAVDKVLHDLREIAGVDAFLSYGCLLGAVRSGRMIGHDSDADVSYLSKHTHPFDITRECLHAARTMRGLGYTVVQMSNADFKIWTRLPDGRRCGIDVFGAYYLDGTLHLMPSRRGELAREALLPTSTITLEGRELPAPARPEDLLALLYGEGWRVPDPSFKWPHDPDLVRHMAGYWRGTRDGLRHWNEFYRSGAAERVPITPSPFVQWVAERVEPGSRFLDVGCGNGRDAVWLAGQGHPVIGLDYSASARGQARTLSRKTPGVTIESLNLQDLGPVLRASARYAFESEPRNVYARFLLDALPAGTRADFWRFASMVQRRGGRTFLEFRMHRSRHERTAFEQHPRRYLKPSHVVEEIEAAGGRIVEQVEGRGLAPFENENPHVCRLVVRWDR